MGARCLPLSVPALTLFRHNTVSRPVSVTEHYTHDVIALAAFAFDADSVRATKDHPCVSIDAMRRLADAIMALLMDPLAM